jgi:hypothetical protein
MKKIFFRLVVFVSEHVREVILYSIIIIISGILTFGGWGVNVDVGNSPFINLPFGLIVNYVIVYLVVVAFLIAVAAILLVLLGLLRISSKIEDLMEIVGKWKYSRLLGVIFTSSYAIGVFAFAIVAPISLLMKVICVICGLLAVALLIYDHIHRQKNELKL